MVGIHVVFRVTVMGRFLKIALIALGIGMALNAMAEDVTQDQIKGLGQQVQEVKKEVLEISTEIIQIEEKTIAPPNSQITLFIAMDSENIFSIESVKIRIDGKEVVSHVYTIKELEALQRGGVQRIYTGNMRGGEHALDVALIGKSSSNKDFQQNAGYKFTKDKGAKIIEMILAGSGSGSGSHDITFRD